MPEYYQNMRECLKKISDGMQRLEAIKKLRDESINYHTLIQCIYDLCDAYTAILIINRGHYELSPDSVKLSGLEIDVNNTYHLFSDDAQLCLKSGDRVHIPKQCAEYLMFLLRETDAVSPDRIMKKDLGPFERGLDYYRLWVVYRIKDTLRNMGMGEQKKTISILLSGISKSEYSDFIMPKEVDHGFPSTSVGADTGEDQTIYTVKAKVNLINIDENNYETKNAVIRNQHFLEAQESRDGTVSQFAAGLSNNLKQLKDLLSRLLNNFDDSQLEEIIQPFVDVCSQMICSYSQLYSEKYDKVKTTLIGIFGDDAWNKLQDESKEFLISARAMFDSITDCFDYSAICILVCKALEVELRYRLFTEYQKYLLENEQECPPSLNKKGGNRAMTHADFTLGSVRYVLCIDLDKKTWRTGDEQSKEMILDYMKNKLMKRYNEKEIEEILVDYAEQTEMIKNTYRNRAVHEAVIRKLDAEKCMNIVIYTEKLLRRMLESFEF